MRLHPYSEEAIKAGEDAPQDWIAKPPAPARSSALEVLRALVNERRYRGPSRSGPMSDGYAQPVNYFDMRDIAEAALHYIVALEQNTVLSESSSDNRG